MTVFSMCQPVHVTVCCMFLPSQLTICFVSPQPHDSLLCVPYQPDDNLFCVGRPRWRFVLHVYLGRLWFVLCVSPAGLYKPIHMEICSMSAEQHDCLCVSPPPWQFVLCEPTYMTICFMSVHPRDGLFCVLFCVRS